MYCSKCGHKVTGGTAVCPECGQDLSYESTRSRTISDASSGKKRKRGFSLLSLVPWALIALLASVVYLFGIAPGKVEGSSPEQIEGAREAASNGVTLLIPTWTPEETAVSAEPTERPEPTPTTAVTPYANLPQLAASPMETPAPEVTPEETPTPTPTLQPSVSPTPTAEPSPTPAPEEEGEEVAVPLTGGSYILPDSSTKRITESDLASLSAAEIRIARNEIYARHGLIFKSEDLQSYFNAQPWYKGTVQDAGQIALNDIEAANVSFINDYEMQHGLT